jgi:hypothetical protein
MGPPPGPPPGESSSTEFDDDTTSALDEDSDVSSVASKYAELLKAFQETASSNPMAILETALQDAFASVE